MMMKCKGIFLDSRCTGIRLPIGQMASRLTPAMAWYKRGISISPISVHLSAVASYSNTCKDRFRDALNWTKNKLNIRYGRQGGRPRRVTATRPGLFFPTRTGLRKFLIWMERRPLKIMKNFQIPPDLIQKYTSDKLAQIQRINQQKCKICEQITHQHCWQQPIRLLRLSNRKEFYDLLLLYFKRLQGQ